ncbi:MAG: Ig-like domain-containing protein, partial [Prevotellaceae bacterium]|nr:Ig-like domain-containing protein [Prevotellaceae bacterium]
MKKIFFAKTIIATIILMLASINAMGENVVYSFSALGNSNINSPSGNIDANISFSTQKNSPSNVPVYNGASQEIRMYYHSTGDGNSITLTPGNGAIITEVTITAVNTYTPTVKYNVDGNADVEASLSGTVYTISGITAAASLKIRNANTSENKQLRFTSIEITYTAPSCNTPDLQFSVANVTKFEGDANFTHTATSAAGSRGTITYSSSNPTVATVNSTSGEVTVLHAGITNIQALISSDVSFCEGLASYTLKVYPFTNAKTYSLVTSSAGLVANAKYLIIGKKGSEYYALGWQKTSNRHAIEVPVENNEVEIGVATTVTPVQDDIYPYEITLENSASGFMLYDALNNGYLRPNSSGATGSTGLLTNAQEAYWAITFANDDAADIECTGSIDGADFKGYVFMKFNATNNPPLFNCYNNATSQTSVYLYKEVANSGTTDTDAPVLTFNPLDNATNVSVSTAITITSNEPLKNTDGTDITNGDLSTLIVLKE